MTDPHWLWRLSAPQWLDSAHTELQRGAQALVHPRRLVTHAKRAAGMALNGVLVTMESEWGRSQCEHTWGRSYMDHLRSIAQQCTLEPRLSAPASALLDSAQDPRLVSLGSLRSPANLGPIIAAQSIVDLCQELTDGR